MRISDKIVSLFHGTDKLLHFLVGALIVSQFEVFEWYWPLIGLVVVVVLSVIKELLDDKFDFADILFAFGGGLVELWSLAIRTWIFCDVAWGG